jgi:hypothetical protein
MKSLTERWNAYCERMNENAGELTEPLFGVRDDWALIFFDEYGYFLLAKTEPKEEDYLKGIVSSADTGKDYVLRLEDAEGNQTTPNLEVGMIWGYWDHFIEMFNGKLSI